MNPHISRAPLRYGCLGAAAALNSAAPAGAQAVTPENETAQFGETHARAPSLLRRLRLHRVPGRPGHRLSGRLQLRGTAQNRR